MFEIQFYEWDGASGWESKLSVSTRTLGHAKKLSRQMLKAHEVVTTWELRGTGKARFAPFCQVYNRDGVKVATIEAPVRYVDSIATRLRRGETVVV